LSLFLFRLNSTGGRLLRESGLFALEGGLRATRQGMLRRMLELGIIQLTAQVYAFEYGIPACCSVFLGKLVDKKGKWNSIA
jgi:hypothetical protein